MSRGSGEELDFLLDYSTGDESGMGMGMDRDMDLLRIGVQLSR